MTEAEKIALAMVNEVADQYGMMEYTRIDRKAIPLEALCRAIEQHEAFKRDVSDAMQVLQEYVTEDYSRGNRTTCITLIDGRSVQFSRFIIKPPADPLVEALDSICIATEEYPSTKYAERLRQALAARGLQITEVGQ